MFETKSKLLSEQQFLLLTQEKIDAIELEGLSDSTTMCFYIPLPEEITKAFDKYNNVDVDLVWAEYWIDEDSCHYTFHGDGTIEAVTDDFDCEYLHNILKEKYNKTYKENGSENQCETK